MNHAISAVEAPSSVRSNEAADASVRTRPAINNNGPITPPKAMAPGKPGQFSPRQRHFGRARYEERPRPPQHRDADSCPAVQQACQYSRVYGADEHFRRRRRHAEQGGRDQSAKDGSTVHAINPIPADVQTEHE